MFKKFFRIFNFWHYPIEVFHEIQEWKIVNKALKEPGTIEAFQTCKLEKPSELRINRIGEIYTVINVPEDIYMSQTGIWPYIMEKMKLVDDVLIRCRLSDLVYPSIQHIPETRSWLLVLSPKREYLKIGKFLFELLRWFFIIMLFKISFNILSHFNVDILTFLVNTFKIIKNFIW